MHSTDSNRIHRNRRGAALWLAPLWLAALVASSLTASAFAIDESGGAVLEAPARAEPRPWEWQREGSDIPVDPSYRFGVLDNGLRYAWKANAEPDARSYIRLHVNAGSLSETDAEHGMAHFLEHMAFNGSENFAAGTLIEWFQKHGMAFGADTNAFTSFGETVYEIDLPVSDEASLREGLQVLRDFAGRLLLEKDEIEAEKGVIDGEEREGDSAMRRVFEEMLDRTYAGTRYTERLPIGTKPVRDAFTTESVRAFYRKWYRPETMTLLLVGDLGELDPSKLIRDAFADFTPPAGPPAQEPPIGEPTLDQRFFFIRESEIPTVQIAISRVRPYTDDADSRARRTREIPLEFARAMLNLRFAELAKMESAPFLQAGIDTATQLDVFEGESLSVVCAPDDWREAIAACEQELRRAIEHGFQKAELEELRADALRGLDEAVERESTRSSGSHIASLLAAAEYRFVPNDASSRREIRGPVIRGLTVEACQKALAESWKNGTLTISGVGNVDLGDKGGDALREAYEASLEVKVQKGSEIAGAEWAYGSADAEPGKIRSRSKADDLGLVMVEFENGVRLNLKKTDFKKNQILLAATLGEGRLSLPDDRHTVAIVADAVMAQGGLAAHDVETLRRLMAGKVVSVAMTTGEDHVGFGGATTAADLQLELELLAATIAAPGWRDSGLVQFRRIVPRSYEALDHQHQGPLVRDFLPALYANDPRFSYPAEEEMMAVGMDDVRSWLEPVLANAPLEVTLVGDLDVDLAIGFAAKTIGRLPERRERSVDEKRLAVPTMKTGLEKTYEIETVVAKSLVLIVFPIGDGIDAVRRREQAFLAEVVNDRLRVEIREKLGVAYSPSAAAQSSEVYPGEGRLMIQVMADPAKADAVVDACLAVAKSLAEKGVTEDEVERLREPVLAQIRDAQRTNGFWVGSLGRAQAEPETLDEVRSLTKAYASITAERLSKLAAKRLASEHASVLVVHPKGAAPKPEDDASEDGAAPSGDSGTSGGEGSGGN